MTTLTEADTCRKYVLPKLYAAGWNDDQISEQKSFTDGRLVVAGAKPFRRPQKRADYLLKYRRDYALAVVEAKSVYKKPGDGLQQAKDYAEILGLKFAYSTNGEGIVEHDFFTGKDNDLESFPTPEEIWNRLKAAENITSEISERVLAPYYHLSGKTPRYYQEIAINRAVQAILQGALQQHRRRFIVRILRNQFTMERFSQNGLSQSIDTRMCFLVTGLDLVSRPKKGFHSTDNFLLFRKRWDYYGMNCGLRRAFQREKNPCHGCKHAEMNIPVTRANCKMRTCTKRTGNFCCQCPEFPCDRLWIMDKRYRTKYGMSEIENLEFIRKEGIRKFVAAERKRWISEKGIFCVHDKKHCKP